MLLWFFRFVGQPSRFVRMPAQASIILKAEPPCSGRGQRQLAHVSGVSTDTLDGLRALRRSSKALSDPPRPAIF